MLKTYIPSIIRQIFTISLCLALVNLGAVAWQANFSVFEIMEEEEEGQVEELTEYGRFELIVTHSTHHLSEQSVIPYSLDSNESKTQTEYFQIDSPPPEQLA